MISEARDEDDRRARPLAWAILLSVAIHAVLVPLASWLWLVHLPLALAKRPERETVVASTAVRIETRSVARPRTRVPPRRAPPAVVSRVPQPATRAAPPASRPHELAREAPNAQPQPTREPIRRSQSSLPIPRQVEPQQQAFSREIARLHARDNPLSIASVPREPPAAYRRTYFDVPGHRERDAVQIQLIPIRHWFADATICYYAHYVAQFTAGGNEEGTIPWPVCYPLNDDKIAHPPFVHDVPIPIPPPNYVLPPGTYLTPLLARIYGRGGDR